MSGGGRVRGVDIVAINYYNHYHNYHFNDKSDSRFDRSVSPSFPKVGVAGFFVMIKWTTEQRKLKDLAEWPKNPRQLSQHDAEHIQRSIDKFGLADPLVVNADGRIIGGHQRKRIMLLMDEYGEDAVIDVRIPSRQLTESEADELAIRLNRNSGEWDFDILANEFNVDELLDWGFSQFDLETHAVIVPDFQPVGIDEQSRLDQKAPVVCPECGCEFSPS
jgi:hypothetical protein